MCVENSDGPRIEPYGTPAVTYLTAECVLPICAVMLRSVKYERSSFVMQDGVII